MTPQWIDFTKAPHLPIVAIALIAGNYHHCAWTSGSPHGIENRCGSNHIDVERLSRVCQACSYNRLRGEMKDDIGRNATYHICNQIGVANVTSHIFNENIGHLGGFEVVGVARWIEGITRYLGTESVQPKR
jgi:hypothetical protein